MIFRDLQKEMCDDLGLRGHWPLDARIERLREAQWATETSAEKTRRQGGRKPFQGTVRLPVGREVKRQGRLGIGCQAKACGLIV